MKRGVRVWVVRANYTQRLLRQAKVAVAHSQVLSVKAHELGVYLS